MAAIRLTIPVVVMLGQNELAGSKRIPLVDASIVVVVVPRLGDQALRVLFPDVGLAVALAIPFGSNDPAVAAP